MVYLGYVRCGVDRLSSIRMQGRDVYSAATVIVVKGQGRIHYLTCPSATGTDRSGGEANAEKVYFFSRPKSAEGQDPEQVDLNAEFSF